MDRTIITPYRAEERELSQILYEKLQGLTILHPPSEELRKYIKDDIFIKPNQQAFFHIMAYLFRLHDPVEFRKRFFWPITDKRSEANFRTSTIDYLKHLNEKHQLNWTCIKSYLVLTPGGMKFITFMLDFIKFILSELLKQKEKYLLPSELANLKEQVSESTVHGIVRKNALFKEFASAYLNAIDEVNSTLESKTNLINQHLKELSLKVGLNVDILTSDEFLEKFWSSVQLLHKKEFMGKSSTILAVEQPVKELKHVLEKFQCKEVNHNYDAKQFIVKLKDLQRNIPQVAPIIADCEAKSTKNDADMDINSLISIYNCIHETLDEELKNADQKPYPGHCLMKKLDELMENVKQTEGQVTEFQKMIYTNNCSTASSNTLSACTPNNSGVNLHEVDKTLLHMFVATPPIKIDSQELHVGKSSRLSLADVSNINADPTMHFLTPKALKHRQGGFHKIADETRDQSDISSCSVMNRTTIVDPMFLLRSLKRDTKNCAVTSHDKLENGDISNWSLAIPPREEITPFKTKSLVSKQSPFTPFNCTSNKSVIVSGGSGTKKLSALEKVQRDKINLSTSPSGRLEPLVGGGETPKIVINDTTFKDENSFVECGNIIDEYHSTITNVPKPSVLNFSDDQIAEDSDDKANDIFNTSDTVLNDVSF